jgi:hypothetical protein
MPPDVAAAVSGQWRNVTQIKREVDLLDFVLAVAEKPA